MLIHATENELESAWNEIVGLLGIRHAASSYSGFMEDLRNLNDWMLREYPNITCQELRLAYNMAIKGELTHKGEPIEVFPVLAPRYVGQIISAYQDKISRDAEVMAVYRSQQHIEETKPQQTQAEIDAFMEMIFAEAVAAVQAGNDYPDVGNGLYDWLDSKGMIQFDKADKKGFMADAEPQTRVELAAQAGENTRHPESRRQLKSLIGASMSDNKEFKDRVISRAKYLALNQYLKQFNF